MTFHFEDPMIAELFAAYPSTIREPLLALRALILATATKTEGVGQLTETIRWGQPSYITSNPKTGSTIRLGPVGNKGFGLFFHCQTSLVKEFRASYGSRFHYDGNRALIWNIGDELPTETLTHCIRSALLYHVHKRSGGGHSSVLKKPLHI